MSFDGFKCDFDFANATCDGDLFASLKLRDRVLAKGQGDILTFDNLRFYSRGVKVDLSGKFGFLSSSKPFPIATITCSPKGVEFAVKEGDVSKELSKKLCELLNDVTIKVGSDFAVTGVDLEFKETSPGVPQWPLELKTLRILGKVDGADAFIDVLSGTVSIKSEKATKWFEEAKATLNSALSPFAVELEDNSSTFSIGIVDGNSQTFTRTFTRLITGVAVTGIDRSGENTTISPKDVKLDFSKARIAPEMEARLYELLNGAFVDSQISKIARITRYEIHRDRILFTVSLVASALPFDLTNASAGVSALREETIPVAI